MVQIELSLHAKKLKNVAGAFKGTSDPFAVVTKIASRHGEKPEVLGRTEVVKNSLSPNWSKVFVFDHELGQPTKIAITLFDEVRKGDNKSMGAAVFDLDSLLGARGGCKAKKLRGGGVLHAVARKSKGSGVLRLQLKGTKLKNTEGLFRKSDPFFELNRRVDAAGGRVWDNVFQSPVEKNNLDPAWEEVALEMSVLCGGDVNLPIVVKVFDHESSGKHVLMGQFETTVNGLVEASNNRTQLRLQKEGKDTGIITVTKAAISNPNSSSSSPAPSLESRVANVSISSSTPTPAPASGPNFVDYIAGGCELNVTVAIDFTGSNGDPRKPGTLHHLDPNSHNDYEKAIHAIMSVLSKYDSDKKYPVLGFGAKYDGEVSHCFQCGDQDEVYGIDGIMQAYHEVFKSGLIMSSPTDITEVIQVAAARSQSALQSAQQTGGQAYTVLLIITDGAVSDIPRTAACLEQVSDSPLSIVIVGVGNADFSGMRFLDNLKGKRDICQFVPFNQHARDPSDLSAATLHEIPSQLVGYFTSKGIPPNAARQIEEADIVVGEEEEIDLTLDFGEEEIVVSGGGNAYRSW